MPRRPFVCGNWKMNTSIREAQGLVTDVVRGTTVLRDVDVAVAPPFVHLSAVSKKLDDSRVRLCAQNVHQAEKGAFTGEVAAPMLREVGCAHVIIGHSERRAYFDESDDLVNEKIGVALAHRLDPIVCVGETLDEREGGKTMEVVERQVRGGLAGLSAEDLSRVTLAYEPVWAIGTGKTATPEQAQEVHAFIRGLVADLGGAEVADGMRLQYGGSVKPDNAEALLAQPDIDGALVGGASLDASAFVAIVRAASARV